MNDLVYEILTKLKLQPFNELLRINPYIIFPDLIEWVLKMVLDVIEANPEKTLNI